MIHYKNLAETAFTLRMAAERMRQAAEKRDDYALFLAYCEIVTQHEKIRDIVAGRD